MSLGDLYRRNKISLAGQLRPDRFKRLDYLPNQNVVEWRADLPYLRSCWDAGEATELETDFFEWFDPSEKPPPRPDWPTK